jgi:hypothetical protein
VDIRFKILFIGLLILVGGYLGVIGAFSVYAPRLLSTALDPRGWHRHRLGGPHATGRPIEEIAADLRRLLGDHDRIAESRSQWYVVHDMRVCERELHDVVEEAAAALSLPACPSVFGGWTSVHLGVRLGQLSGAGSRCPSTRHSAVIDLDVPRVRHG